MRPKDSPNGFTQKQSGRSGSRAVRWPAMPSLKPKRSNSRKAAAIRCLMWVRSSSGESKLGRLCGAVGRIMAVPSYAVRGNPTFRRPG